MRMSNVSLPEVYKESEDFRFFVRWFEHCLTKTKYDIENMADLYDPTRCPDWLLWMLADTMGFKYDDRLPVAYNRFVLLYFMSMIRNRGSKDGVTLAAEANLAQFNILDYGKENDVFYNRLEDTSIPVNSAYVTPHVAEGYIDVVYYSTKIPIDACIEYVRPVGMYIAANAGVRFDSRTKISIDARLTNTNDIGISVGPTHVGHYSREDYARLQKVEDDSDYETIHTNPRTDYTYDSGSGLTRREQAQMQRTTQVIHHRREDVWYRNSEYESMYTPNQSSGWINPGWRSLYSLQLCNNEHIVKSLITDPIFGLGYLPQTPEDVSIYGDAYILPSEENLAIDDPNYPGKYPNAWNLRYDQGVDMAAMVTPNTTYEVQTVDDERTDVAAKNYVEPKPQINPVMTVVGDAISLNKMNSQYIVWENNQYEVHKSKYDAEIGDRITDPSEIEID